MILKPRKKDRPSGRPRMETKSDINVTPMADVMLVLLIIFMLTVPAIKQGINVNLPKGINPIEDEGIDGSLTVAITRGGIIYLDRNETKPDELAIKLRDRLTAKAIKTVYVKGDIGVPYQQVVEVIDTCRAAGVERI